MSEYFTIFSINRSTPNQEPKLLIRVHNSITFPPKLALVMFGILLLITPILDRNLESPWNRIPYILLGTSFGISLPIIFLKVIQHPYLLIIYIYGIITGVISLISS